MKKYQLPYGNGFQEVTLPEEKVLYDIHGNKADVQEDIAAATLVAVRCPIASQPLQKVVRKGDKVAVIVSDVTRLVRTAEFLPVMLRVSRTKILLLLLPLVLIVHIHMMKISLFAVKIS